MEDTQQLLQQLNGETAEIRLNALRVCKRLTEEGKMPTPPKTPYVNNHIHTTYSFSPYSPSMALYRAWQAGLCTAGIMDHDSVGGIPEFLAAGEILEMPVTAGMECRVDFSHTAVGMHQINNPDQMGVGYVALHGIPHQMLDTVAAFMRPYRSKRNERNRKMCEKINERMKPYGIILDFDRDVLPLSAWENGGSVTERHVLFALTKMLVKRYPSAALLTQFLTGDMGLTISEKAQRQVFDWTPQYREYDILGILKANLVKEIYVDATEELPAVEDYIALCRKTGAISAYAYLGDVNDSVTGDKKAQKFEDDYLELLFSELVRLGFDAVTYMPTRNRLEQLQRVMALCEKNNLFQISGEDINSPRQSFLCERLTQDAFRHLITATYALIGHERAATEQIQNGMFSENCCRRFPMMQDRVSYFAGLCKTTD